MTSARYLELVHPGALWLLALTPLFAWLLWRAARKSRGAVEAFSSPALAPRLLLGAWRDGGGARAALLLVAFAGLALAAAQPKLGSRLERVQRRGADILVAVDTSNSMLAEDARPSRLEAAKREVLGLVARLQGDRIGVITFSTQAFMYCPLTADYEAAAMFVESITPKMTSGGGTALAAALREAARAFAAGEGDAKAVILVSDGEDWGEGARDEARALAGRGVRIYAIGIGTAAGAPIPVYEGERLAGMKRENGQVVLTRLHTQGLREIAAAGGGRYFEGGTADLGATAVYSSVSALQSARTGYYTFKTYAERFQWPLGAALLLLAWEFLLRLRPSRPKTPAAGLAVLALTCFLFGSGFSLFETAASLCRAANRMFERSRFAEALQQYTRALELQPDSPALHFNRGDALYRQGRLAEAREEFAKAAPGLGPRLTSAAHFNMGNAFLQEQDVDKAIEEYRNALRCDPGNALAKRNLELALRMKKQQQQNPKQDQNREQQQRQRRQQQQPRQPPRPGRNRSPQSGESRPAAAAPMTPDEARALLRQAQYDDAKQHREIVRAMPPTREKTGKDW